MTYEHEYSPRMVGFEHPDATLMAILGTLRQTLHAVPEASGRELLTAEIVAGFLASYSPDQLLRGLGGCGVAAVFHGRAPGPTVLIRADLDAVPVEAEGDKPARSSHLCGHDAHMTMVGGIAPLLAARRPDKGRFVLLFQPAEETGTGAVSILQDPRFASIRPDCAVGLHNLPGFPVRSVVVREGTMASASVGLRCEIVGAASHAAHPEDARTPRRVIARLLEELPSMDGVGEDGRFITITHAAMGRPGFGVTPGRGEIFATLRARTNDELHDLRQRAEALAREAVAAEGLDCSFGWQDDFPATINDPELVATLRSVCELRQIELLEAERPFRWSDDFGHFSSVIPSVYFGLGIGVEAAGLHQPTYEFPDDVMGTGIQVLYHLALRLAQDRPAAGPLDPDSTAHVPEDVSRAIPL